MYSDELQPVGKKRKRVDVEDGVASKRSRAETWEGNGNDDSAPSKIISPPVVASNPTHEDPCAPTSISTGKGHEGGATPQDFDGLHRDDNQTQVVSGNNVETKEKSREHWLSQQHEEPRSSIPQLTHRDSSDISTLVTDAAHPVAARYAKLEWMKPYARKKVICKLFGKSLSLLW